MNDDLKNNPLDDYTPGPSLLDKATSSIVDHISDYMDAVAGVVADAVDTSKTKLSVERIEKQVNKIDNDIKRHGPFTGDCPDFGFTKTKQIIMEQMWKSNQRHQSYSFHDYKMQSIVVALSAAIIKKLSIHHFIGLQVSDKEYTEIFTLQPNITYNNEMNTNDIVSQVVNIQKHRLKHTLMVPSSPSDLESPLYREVLAQIAQDIAKELYHKVREQLQQNALDTSSEYRNDTSVVLQLYAESVDIGKRSFRGNGNIMIVSNAIAAALIRSNTLMGADDKERRYGHVNFIGKVGNASVYVDATMEQSQAIMLYKGISETDAGIFWCMGNIIQLGALTVDTFNFAPSIPINTFYGTGYATSNTPNDINVDAVSKYITVIEITNIPYSVEDDKMLTELFDSRPLPSALINTTELYGAHKL